MSTKEPKETSELPSSDLLREILIDRQALMEITDIIAKGLEGWNAKLDRLEAKIDLIIERSK